MSQAGSVEFLMNGAEAKDRKKYLSFRLTFLHLFTIIDFITMPRLVLTLDQGTLDEEEVSVQLTSL
jgi:hypothetical protein